MATVLCPISIKAVVAYDFNGLNAPGIISTSSDYTNDQLSIKNTVIAEFGTSSPMVDVARCESTFQQFNSDGEVLRGKVNNKDVGTMQINEYWHLDEANNLGIDIYTTKGNILFARYLYDKYGLQPWINSEPCWGSSIASI